MEGTKKVYYGFDLLKFLMALLIVATHSQLFVEYECTYHVATIIYSLAVPTFFAISTFLYVKKLFQSQTANEAWSLCKKDITRLFLLGCFWFVVDMPMTWDTFFSIANWKEIIASFVVVYPFRGLWFVVALIINKLVLFIFRQHLYKLTFFALFIFIFFSLGYTPLFHGFSHPLHPYFNFYFHTFFCCVGALYARNSTLISKLKISRLFLLLLLVFVWHLYNYDYAVIVWRIICPFFFMSLFMSFREPSKRLRPFFIFMRKISILFYFLHFNFLWLYSNIFCLEKYIFFDQSIVRYLTTIICCFLISIVVLWLEKKRYFSLLRFSH